ncbi:MAG TPA: glycogen/starch synthase [Pirellulales bacterium]|nr:glycogen/starch synthase [Pirellulales bacterium]
MKILLATSEAVPFAKTGGLADVCGALPLELARLGHQSTLIMPAYRQVFQAGLPIEPVGLPLEIRVGQKTVSGRLLRSFLPIEEKHGHTSSNNSAPSATAAAGVPVYFVEQAQYFDRDQLYGPGLADYRDNCERFVFFSRAVLDVISHLNLGVDLLHVHDWQTGLIPAYLKIEYRSKPGYEKIASLLTIHNLSYQGTFWHWDMLLTGLDWKYFNWRQMEFFGNLNLLKTGLVFADAINTVSPRYAEEIQSAPLGCGLEGVLQHRRAALSGILNGVDYHQWDPATDVHLPAKYGPDNVREGKAANKAALQAELNLAPDPNVPLLAFVGRMVEQKGVDLIAQVMQEWVLTSRAQWVVLGTGDAKVQEQLALLAQRFPQKVAAKFQFSDPLAHRIEAAADLFLMPSRFEPCGLSQMYSLKYGTVPVVRVTGGLADTIVDTTEETLAAGSANGFTFYEPTSHGLSSTLKRALAYHARPEAWLRLMTNGMTEDWSWTKSAKQYADLYATTIARAQVPAVSKEASGKEIRPSTV